MNGQSAYAGGYHSTMVSVGYGGAVTNESSENFTLVGTAVDKDRWTCGLTYWIRDHVPTAAKITNVRVGGTGWSFEAYADRVGILPLSKVGNPAAFVASSDCADGPD